jgi:anthranilate phosphoribosyltransferase
MSDLKSTLAHLASGMPMPIDMAREAFSVILDGQADAGQIGAFLMALHMRGETVEELAAGAEVMRAHALAVEAPDDAIDTCGTGGDGSGSYNISTAVAFVVAACGVPVAKHGNRALSSKSGSSQVLETLGVNLNLSPAAISQCLREVGMGFMFAPAHHAAMRHVGPVRQALGIRTIFNLLGPLSNPARAKRQLLGVFDRRWLVPLAETLNKLGSTRAWIVHGEDGLDELTTTGTSYVATLANGDINSFEICPEDVGLKRASPSDLIGGTPEENAQALLDVLAGKSGAYRDIVLLNSAAALVVADKISTIADGIALAGAAIDSGGASNVLAALIATSEKLAHDAS